MSTHLAAVLWDMDGTLLDSEVLWDDAVYDLSERLGRRLTPAVRETTLGNSMYGALSKVFAYCDVDPTPDAFEESAQWLRTRVGEMFDAGLPWRAGAKDLLRAVRAAGLRAALVTNTERVLTEKALNTLGREYFDAVVCGDEVRAGKPEPEPYERAAELLGLDPGRCLAVEDSPTGTHAAETAGCAVLVVPSTVAVVPRPGVVLRESLVGLDVAGLRRVYADAMG
ncbi:HAD family phosphatase [Aldersonia sp. NBC_00410]|uniref:HAD family hydrolase n=1 Tax=Aldersonia sp. NBC_00410 TaxID=2975954 RepID=UPI002257E678|nr:HAD family phosphatase [Aldersonia sp. NBC_00410]MCX5045843.1 HAD family phosphatase [Aldersonia sp. NBC_00410]